MLHTIDVEFDRSFWWYSSPVYTVRGDADIARCLTERRPYTVVYDYDTEARP